MRGGDLLSTFTPSNMSHEMLERIFVRRHRLLERLVQSVAAAASSDARPHQLLVGPRGMGKTHLISMLYWRTRKNPEVDPRVRIAWLSEDEYGAPTYRHLLVRLLEQLEKEYPDPQLKAKFPALRASLNLVADAEALLWETVGDRLLVIFAENLDQLFEQWGDDGQKSVRALLQNRRALLVATTPQLFSALSSQNKPFYGFFNAHHLDELTVEEARDMLYAVAQWRGDVEMQEYLQTDTAIRRLKVIEALAGGHPRIWILFAGFLTKEGLDELVQTFHERLDLLTAYFQERMQRLSPQQRQIVRALVDQTGAKPVKDIADRSMIDEKSCSVQLRRLDEIGFVRSFASGREKYYELREPLMRLAIDIKESKGRPLSLIVSMLKCWFGFENLKKWQEDASGSWEKLYISSAFELATRSIVEASQLRQEVEKFVKENLWEEALKVQEEIIQLFQPDEFLWDSYSKLMILLNISTDMCKEYAVNINVRSFSRESGDDFAFYFLLSLANNFYNEWEELKYCLNVTDSEVEKSEKNSRIRYISYLQFFEYHVMAYKNNNEDELKDYLKLIDSCFSEEFSGELKYVFNIIVQSSKYKLIKDDKYLLEIPAEYRDFFILKEAQPGTDQASQNGRISGIMEMKGF